MLSGGSRIGGHFKGCVGMLMRMRDRKGVISISKICHWKDPLGEASRSRNLFSEVCLLFTQITLQNPNPATLPGAPRDNSGWPLGWSLKLNMLSIWLRGSRQYVVTGQYKEGSLCASRTYFKSGVFISITGSNSPSCPGRQVWICPLVQWRKVIAVCPGMLLHLTLQIVDVDCCYIIISISS